MAEKNLGGRPTKYKPEYGEQIISDMERGLSLAASGAGVGVSRQTVYEWYHKHEEFRKLVDVAKVSRQRFFEERLVDAKSNVEFVRDSFILKNAGREDWRDKQDVEVTGADGGPVQVEQIRRVIVDPKGEK